MPIGSPAFTPTGKAANMLIAGGGTAGSLVANPNDGHHVFASDINTPIPFDGTFHFVTWSNYSGMPTWADVTDGDGSEEVSFDIVEPGMYLVAPNFSIFTNPTASGTVMRTLGETFWQDVMIDIDTMKAALAINGSPITTPTEVAVLTESDLPWSFYLRLKGTDDDTCVIEASVYIQQLAKITAP